MNKTLLFVNTAYWGKEEHEVLIKCMLQGTLQLGNWLLLDCKRHPNVRESDWFTPNSSVTKWHILIYF